MNESTGKKQPIKEDHWQPTKYHEPKCDGCVWEHTEYEESIDDGGAPCKRCTRWDGIEW